MVSWQLPVLLHIVIGKTVTPILIKKHSGSASRLNRFFLQYFFCSILALILAAAFRQIQVDKTFALIILIGFFNGLGAYCQWRAMDISLSKTSLFTFWDDIIAMTLSYFILKEGKFMNTAVWVGLVMSTQAVILLAAHEFEKKSKEKSLSHYFSLYFFVGTYSVIWGLAVFFMRYYGVNGVSPLKFVARWYSGAFLAACILKLCYREKQLNDLTPPALTLKEKFSIFILSVSIMASLASAYWSYMLVPQTVVQPIFLVAEMVLSALLGLYVFKEIKELDFTGKVCFIFGIAGALLIALNF